MIDRRRFLHAAIAATALSSTALHARPDDRPLAALLVPLTGAHADLGRALVHAAQLAEPNEGLIVLDSGATPASAAAAAQTAVRRGVPLIIGPVFGEQVAAVVAAARGVPVVALSNDPAATGAFVLGITPAQTVGAVLGYARSRGARRIALVGGTARWDALAAAAAVPCVRAFGLDLVAADQADALLVTGDADALSGAARSFDGVQLLGTCQSIDAVPGSIEGAWFAAPDPDGVADFARRFETAFGNPPGQLAALAYDAVGIARSVRASGHAGRPNGYADRNALLGSAGFAGITGGVRFTADGRAARELAIVVVESGRFRTVARATA